MTSVLIKVFATALFVDVHASQAGSTAPSVENGWLFDGTVGAEETSLFQIRVKTEKEQFQDMQNVSALLQPEERTCHLQELQGSPHPPKDFAHFDHGSYYQGLYVNKEAKFAFCLIEKNACSAWIAIFTKLQSGHMWGNGFINYELRRQTFSPDAAAEVFKDPSATRAVFVRDPLERFLSAFLEKCIGSGCSNGYCLMRQWLGTAAGVAIPFKQAVDWARVTNLTQVDGHWTFQSHHCELNSRLAEYTTLGIMTSETLAEDATCLLEKAGLSYLNVKSDEKNAPAFWQVPASARDPKETQEFLKSFYTKSAAEALYKVFEQDYKVFNLPRPSWIQHAHGKFFEDVREKPCQVKKDAFVQSGVSNAHSSFSDSIEEDDIPMLARRAGFTL